MTYRVYLDTGTFQAIHDCDDYVLGEDPLPTLGDYPAGRSPQVVKRPDGVAILEALRKIFLLNDRAHFDWVVSPASLAEIDAANNIPRSRYARDVLDHTNICLSENPPEYEARAMASILQGPTFGNISEKDRKLLIEAAGSQCDVFLTIEKKLPKQADSILKKVPLIIATPVAFWKMLERDTHGL